MSLKTVIGNWKLHPTTQNEAQQLAQNLATIDTRHVKVGCCPGFVHLAGVAQTLTDSKIWVGAQDVAAFGVTGAFTGDVSAAQLADSGARFTLIGHSERRTYHQENNDLIIQKIQQAQTANLLVVLCIGETHAQYQNGETLAVLDAQLSILTQCSIAGQHLLIAYEPVWAIGTGLTPTVAEITAVHRHIKATLAAQNRPDVCVLYGGSVNEHNAQELAQCPDINGALVGGASLKINSFAAIVAAFSQAAQAT